MTGGLTTADAARFWAKVDKTGPVGSCWLWTAATDRGYAVFGVTRQQQRRTYYGHRLAYEMTVGAVPAGLVLDHLCRNRSCVNPAHLEPVSQRVNILRGTGASARNVVKTHCAHGHPFTSENTYIWRGTRKCRTCTNWRSPTAVGLAIRDARLSAGLTQRQLADLLGLDKQRVSDWECGANEPGAENSKRLAAVLGNEVAA